MGWFRRVVLRSGGELPRCGRCGATLNTSGTCSNCDHYGRH